MSKILNGKATNQMFIKIGRINKKVEERMGVSLSNDIAIYLLEPMADNLAREHPTSYLSLIEEMALTIKRPDAFSYCGERNELLYLRLYPKGKELFLLKVSVIQSGRPLKWVVKGFYASKSLSDASLSSFPCFYRLEREKEGGEGAESIV
ncbi:MAG: hypothetical protein K6B65_03865 [Bacilli bacterium]|nr:hypothetical protein [Bacilli bacterium]